MKGFPSLFRPIVSTVDGQQVACSSWIANEDVIGEVASICDLATLRSLSLCSRSIRFSCLPHLHYHLRLSSRAWIHDVLAGSRVHVRILTIVGGEVLYYLQSYLQNGHRSSQGGPLGLLAYLPNLHDIRFRQVEGCSGNLDLASLVGAPHPNMQMKPISSRLTAFANFWHQMITALVDSLTHLDLANCSLSSMLVQGMLSAQRLQRLALYDVFLDDEIAVSQLLQGKPLGLPALREVQIVWTGLRVEGHVRLLLDLLQSISVPALVQLKYSWPSSLSLPHVASLFLDTSPRDVTIVNLRSLDMSLLNIGVEENPATTQMLRCLIRLETSLPREAWLQSLLRLLECLETGILDNLKVLHIDNVPATSLAGTQKSNLETTAMSRLCEILARRNVDFTISVIAETSTDQGMSALCTVAAYADKTRELVCCSSGAHRKPVSVNSPRPPGWWSMITWSRLVVLRLSHDSSAPGANVQQIQSICAMLSSSPFPRLHRIMLDLIVRDPAFAEAFTVGLRAGRFPALLYCVGSIEVLPNTSVAWLADRHVKRLVKSRESLYAALDEHRVSRSYLRHDLN